RIFAPAGTNLVVIYRRSTVERRIDRAIFDPTVPPWGRTHQLKDSHGMSGSGRKRSTKLDRSLVIQQRLAWLANSSNWDGKLPSPKKLTPAAAAAAAAAVAGSKTACAERGGMTGGSGYDDNKPR
ncbi:unnamed protein product, partial [Ectocarpus sp. 12 AP-2014]